MKKLLALSIALLLLLALCSCNSGSNTSDGTKRKTADTAAEQTTQPDEALPAAQAFEEKAKEIYDYIKEIEPGIFAAVDAETNKSGYRPENSGAIFTNLTQNRFKTEGEKLKSLLEELEPLFFAIGEDPDMGEDITKIYSSLYGLYNEMFSGFDSDLRTYKLHWSTHLLGVTSGFSALSNKILTRTAP